MEVGAGVVVEAGRGCLHRPGVAWGQRGLPGDLAPTEQRSFSPKNLTCKGPGSSRRMPYPTILENNVPKIVLTRYKILNYPIQYWRNQHE